MISSSAGRVNLGYTWMRERRRGRQVVGQGAEDGFSHGRAANKLVSMLKRLWTTSPDMTKGATNRCCLGRQKVQKPVLKRRIQRQTLPWWNQAQSGNAVERILSLLRSFQACFNRGFQKIFKLALCSLVTRAVVGIHLGLTLNYCQHFIDLPANKKHP